MINIKMKKIKILNMNKDRVVNHLDEKGGKNKPQQKQQPQQKITLNGKPSGNAKDKTKGDTQSKDAETSNNVETPNNVDTNDKNTAEIIVKEVPEIKPEQAEKLATKIQDVKKEKPSLNLETIINRLKTKFNKKSTDDGKGSGSGDDKTPTDTGDDKTPTDTGDDKTPEDREKSRGDKNNNDSDTNKNDIFNNQSSDNVTDNAGGEEVENTSDNQEKNKNNSDTKSSDKDSLNNGDFNEYELPNDAWNKQIKFFTSNPALLWFGGKADGIASFIGDVATLGLLSRKTIKGRFRKTVKTLYKLQKDFGGSEKGLDMNDAFKGQGSRLMDMLMRVFFVGNKYSAKGGTGAIGIIPLVNNYRNELKRDFVDAVKTYNMIATAGKQPKDLGAIKDSYVPEYKSFAEAYKARMLNESAYQREDLYETLTDFIAEANTAKINYSAGKYVMYTRDKDGNLKPSQSVQVTPESTREICYSIMNIFFSKYFNMKNVSNKFGINVNSLSDIDKSNVDKFTKVIKSLKTEQSDNNIASKLFARVEKRYESIVSSYEVIAKKVIENFDKYSRLNKDGETKALSEKDDNLLTSATTKLYEKLKEQIDIYDNNFYRVVNTIIATPEYTKYMKFIIDTVIPVFTTGNAGDADFILDTLPKAGEFFIVRQTRDKNVSNTSISVDGTAALVKILSIDNKGNNSKSPIVQIQRVGLFKPVEGHEGGQIAIGNNGSVDYKSIDFKTSVILDRTAFSRKVNDNSGDIQTVPYNKWLAIDPVPVTNYSEAGENTETNNDNDTVTLGKTLDDGSAEYVFIIPNGNVDSSIGPVTPYSNVSSSETPSKEFEPDAVMNEDENTDNKTVNTIRVLIKDQQNKIQHAIDIKPKQNIGIDNIINILTTNKFNKIEPDKTEAIKAEAKNVKVDDTEDANNENHVITIIKNMNNVYQSYINTMNTLRDTLKQQTKMRQDQEKKQNTQNAQQNREASTGKEQTGQPTGGQQPIKKDSVKIHYVSPAINESMTAVKLVRNAVFESNKNAYLVSMTCWGDGTRNNPVKFLEESVKSVVYNATSYSDIANAAKKDKNLNILPLTESVTYQVPMPYNRYAILTNGNPLYEAVAVITIDATPDHNITSSKFIGVTRIVK